MKATVNKSIFLSYALPMMDFDRISVAAFAGILSVASFGNAVNFRIPAYIVEPGQAYLSTNEWRQTVAKVQEADDKMLDIVL